MARMYTNYLNNGREGCTWAALVATTLATATVQWMTVRQIAEDIWAVRTSGRGTAPPALLSQVDAALDRLAENKLIHVKRAPKGSGSLWQYALAASGSEQFDNQSGIKPWIDSELFQPNHRPKKATRNNIVRFRPARKAG